MGKFIQPDMVLKRLSKTDRAFSGDGLSIVYGVGQAPFGACFLAVCDAGICYLGLPSSKKGVQDVVEYIKHVWPAAVFTEDNADIEKKLNQLFFGKAKPLPLLVKGTDFQIQVWQALLDIPLGSVVSYTDIANTIGKPKAHRAVGSAVGKNPVSFFIPCHRVLHKDGGLGGYMWGLECKERLLGWEKSLAS